MNECIKNQPNKQKIKQLSHLPESRCGSWDLSIVLAPKDCVLQRNETFMDQFMAGPKINTHNNDDNKCSPLKHHLWLTVTLRYASRLQELYIFHLNCYSVWADFFSHVLCSKLLISYRHAENGHVKIYTNILNKESQKKSLPIGVVNSLKIRKISRVLVLY